MTWLVWSELTVQQRSSVRLLPVAALLMGVHFFGGPVEAMVLPVLVIAVFAWRAALPALGVAALYLASWTYAAVVFSRKEMT